MTTTTTTTIVPTTSTTSTTSTTTACSTSFFTTKAPCEIDPVYELIETAINSIIKLPYANNSSIAENLSRILDKGIIDDSCKYCCPDCGNTYIIAGKEAFMDFAIAIGWAEQNAIPA